MPGARSSTAPLLTPGPGRGVLRLLVHASRHCHHAPRACPPAVPQRTGMQAGVPSLGERSAAPPPPAGSAPHAAARPVLARGRRSGARPRQRAALGARLPAPEPHPRRAVLVQPGQRRLGGPEQPGGASAGQHRSRLRPGGLCQRRGARAADGAWGPAPAGPAQAGLRAAMAELRRAWQLQPGPEGYSPEHVQCLGWHSRPPGQLCSGLLGCWLTWAAHAQVSISTPEPYTQTASTQIPVLIDFGERVSSRVRGRAAALQAFGGGCMAHAGACGLRACQ